MGIGGISIWQLLIVLAIVIMLFGTKRLRNIGGDLGAAVKGFKNSVQDDDKTQELQDDSQSNDDTTDDSKKNHSEQKNTVDK